MRRLVIVVAASAVAALTVATPAWADLPEPEGGCGSGFELMTVKKVLRELAAPGFEDAIIAEDKNADDYLCVKVIPNEGGPPQFDPAFAYVDNTAR